MPAHWARVSETRRCVRVRPPPVRALVADLALARDRRDAEAAAAWAAAQARLAAHVPPLRALASRLADYDCLLSLAAVAASEGYTRPRVLPHEAAPRGVVRIRAGRHPLLAQGAAATAAPVVPNDVVLGGGEGGGEDAPRCVVV